MVNRPLLLSAVAFAACALSLAGCSKDPEVSKRAYVKSGDDYVAQGKLNEAVIQYKSATNADPRYGEAHLKLAETLAKKGDAGGAYREFFFRAAELLPADMDTQLKAGAMSLFAGQFADARARADKVLEAEPGNVQGLVLRGNALAGLKDLAAAIDSVEEAIKADPERGLSYANLGAMQLIGGDKETAERSFLKAVTLAPQSVPARQALANFYASTGKRDLAEKTLKQALVIEPENVPVNKALAYLLMATNRAREAEAPLKLIADKTKDISTRFVLAELYRSTERTPLAIEVLDEVAKQPAAFAMARARKSALLYNGGKHQEAYAAVEEVLAKEPKNSVALLQKATLLASDKDLDQALTLAKAATAAAAGAPGPSAAVAWFAVGRIHSGLGQAEEALTAFKEALRLAPKFVPAMIESCRMSFQLGQIDDALQFSQSALTLQPQNADANLLKARALMTKGDTFGAEAPMRLVLAAAPSSPAVQAQLGMLYAQKRDLPAARAAYERALAADPANLDALAGLATLDFSEKKGPRAIARIEEALAKHPDSPALLLLAAQVNASLGDRAQAERRAKRVIEIDPSNLAAYGLLGQIFASSGRLDEAVAQFEEAGKHKPKAVMFPTIVGLLLEAQNKRAEAAKQYEQALRIDSRAGVAANNLANILIDTGGDLNRALQLAQTARAQLPDNPDVADTLGWIYVKRHNGALAVTPLLLAVGKQPTRPIFHYHLAMAYADSGNRQKAIVSLQKALSFNTDFDGIADAKAKLAELTKGVSK